MATFLDLSLLGFFGSIFMFLFVFALTYGVLTLTKIFKDVSGEKGIYGLISLAIALAATISADATTIITTLTPWFTVLIVFLFLLFIVFRMFSGGDGAQLEEAIKSPGVSWTIIVIAVIILISSLSSTFGQDLLDDQNVPISNIDDNNEINRNTDSQEIQVDITDDIDSDLDRPRSGSSTQDQAGAPIGSTATNDFGDNVLATIINPKVMGLIAMMLIAFFTILLIARSPDPDT